MDTMETLPLPEFADETPVAKPGDIPDPPMPPQGILDAVLEGMTQKPGVAFDPRAQHKKQFRAHVKGRVFTMSHSAAFHHQWFFSTAIIMMCWNPELMVRSWCMETMSMQVMKLHRSRSDN